MRVSICIITGALCQSIDFELMSYEAESDELSDEEIREYVEAIRVQAERCAAAGLVGSSRRLSAKADLLEEEIDS